MRNFFKILFYNFFFIFLIYSCSSDSNDDDQSAPPNDIGPQYIAENDSIVEFLKTHFYNYEDFENLASNQKVELVIDTIDGDNSGKTPLYDQVSTMSISIEDENEDMVAHNLYYIINREGNGANPTVADSIYVSYKGMLLGKSTFDSRKNPIWLDQTSVVRGFQEFTPLLKSFLPVLVPRVPAAPVPIAAFSPVLNPFSTIGASPADAVSSYSLSINPVPFKMSSPLYPKTPATIPAAMFPLAPNIEAPFVKFVIICFCVKYSFGTFIL